MKRKNWTNTDAQSLSDAHDTGRPLIGSGLLCARLARDTRGTLPDIHLIRPARSFRGRGVGATFARAPGLSPFSAPSQ